jgi:hypothetical protein
MIGTQKGVATTFNFMERKMTTTPKITTTRNYSGQISMTAWNPEHNYKRTAPASPEVNTLELAAAWAHRTHGPKSWKGWTAIWIKEIITTVTESVDEQGRAVRKTEILEQDDAYVEYRSWEDYKTYHLDPLAARLEEQNAADTERENIERNLTDAKDAEERQNELRILKNEPQVFDAYTAWAKLKGINPKYQERISEAAQRDFDNIGTVDESEPLSALGRFSKFIRG